ncbi:F-box protein [Nymphaea thermarum]|nr:F-box protein [Nymphaea thermarum]
MGQATSHPPLLMDSGNMEKRDLTLDLPDDCLALVFHHLSTADRNRCSLVCRRWLAVDSLSRYRLSLRATASLPASSLLGCRFPSLSRLTLRCDRSSLSIPDGVLLSLSSLCPNLVALRLKACRHLSDDAFHSLALPRLVEFSASSCNFGASALNSLLASSPNLESLSIKRLRGLAADPPSLHVSAAASRLRRIHLKELFNAQAFAPLLAGSLQLESLTVVRCSGDWDQILEDATVKVRGLVHLHIERSHVGDRGLSAVAKCASLESFNLIKTPDCTDAGVSGVAAGCRGLRRVRLDGWRMNRIGDVSLTGLAKNCRNLKELVLVGLNPTASSLGELGEGCPGVERLALCGSETIGDGELAVVAAKFKSLRKLCVKGCPVSDDGMGALARGCPELVKVKVKKCRGVSVEGVEFLKQHRPGKALEFELDEEEEVHGKDNLELVVGNERTNVAATLSPSKSIVLRARMSFLVIAGSIRRW